MEELGVDWEGPVGPVGADDDTTIIVEDIQSPLTETQEVALTTLLHDLCHQNDSSTEEKWITQYLAAQTFVCGEL